jgi:hypothetical protein
MFAICTVLALAGPAVVLAWVWYATGDSATWQAFLNDALGGGIRVTGAASLSTRLSIAAVVVSSALIASIGFWHLRAFFRHVRDGAALSFRAASRLTGFARVIVVLALAKPMISAAISVLATLPNPPGQRQLILRFSSDDVVALVVGALLMVIAWTLREGARIARENAEIV